MWKMLCKSVVVNIDSLIPSLLTKIYEKLLNYFEKIFELYVENDLKVCEYIGNCQYLSTILSRLFFR